MRGRTVDFVHYSLQVQGFTGKGVVAGFRAGDDQDGPGAAVDRGGDGVEGNTQAAVGLGWAFGLGGFGGPLHHFVKEDEGRAVADKVAPGGGAGIGEIIVVFPVAVIGGGAAQMIGEVAQQGFGAATMVVQGGAGAQVGIFTGVADQADLIYGPFRRQQAAGLAAAHQFRVLGGGGQGDEGMGLATAEHGVEAEDGGLLRRRALLQAVEYAVGQFLHGLGRVGGGKEVCGGVLAPDFVGQGVVQVCRIMLAGLIRRPGSAGFSDGQQVGRGYLLGVGNFIYLGCVRIKISRDVRRNWKTRVDGASAPIKRLVLYLKIRNVNTP